MRTCNQVTILRVLPSFILLQVNPMAHLNPFYVYPQNNLCEGRPLLSLIAILKSRDSSIPSAPIVNGNGFFSNGNIIKKNINKWLYYVWNVRASLLETNTCISTHSSCVFPSFDQCLRFLIAVFVMKLTGPSDAKIKKRSCMVWQKGDDPF